MDAPIEGMPEFVKPEEIPLVVPDTPSTPDPKRCKGLKKDGTPCTSYHLKDKDFCLIHEPSLEAQRMEWRRLPKLHRRPGHSVGRPRRKNYLSREEVLEILSNRLRLWLEKFGGVISEGVDDAICNLARTYACVAKTEAAEGEPVRGWRMKGAV